MKIAASISGAGAALCLPRPYRLGRRNIMQAPPGNSIRGRHRSGSTDLIH